MSVLIFLTARSAGRIFRYFPKIFNSMPFTIILNTDSGFGIAVEKNILKKEITHLLFNADFLKFKVKNLLRIRLSSLIILNVFRVSIARMPV